jgi:predicted transcriptional regulator
MFEPFERLGGFLGTTPIVAYCASNMSLGDLQAAILGALQRLGKATARDIMEAMGSEKHLAYTTVSTVLDRLHRKGLVRRIRVNGRGGAKYLYSYATPVDIRANLVDRAVTRLVNAFGPSIVPTIYDSLEQISKEDIGELKRKVAKARR